MRLIEIGMAQWWAGEILPFLAESPYLVRLEKVFVCLEKVTEHVLGIYNSLIL